MKIYLLLAVIAYAFAASGYATRYWDCCKPSCSWTGNAGAGNEARECDYKSMNVLNGHGATSVCDGGNSATCISQVPQVVSSNLAYAFAAAPGNGPNVCGKCFELKFTGTGKYETQENHRRLVGKRLIVMASNIGYDVAGGQFDVMIPGGGVGIFNGCREIMSTAGAQYGGLLSDCESQAGYSGDVYGARKSCLIQKCKDNFPNATLQQGCLFLAEWMEAAGNPNVEYTEVACPSALKDRY